MVHVFTDLARAAGLHLNLGKCVIIPLYLAPSTTVAAEVADVAPTWSNMVVSASGKYLGHEIGPGKGHTSWTSALAKAASRVQQWDWATLGLYFSTLVWNTFVISTLTFVAQLEAPPPKVDDVLHNL